MKDYRDVIQFKENFKLSNQLFNDFIKFATDAGVERNLTQIKQSKELIIRGLRADISRNLHGNFGYYVIINDDDTAVKKALESLKK
jgi:carboxyl-terminal processing protease